MDKKALIEERKLWTLRTVVGDAWFHTFLMGDGTTKEVETTKESYEQLAGFNKVNPVLDGGVWQGSYSCRKFDNGTTKLKSKEYYKEKDRYMSLGKDGKTYSGTDLDDLILKNEAFVWP